MIALDASAFRAFLFREKAHERVAAILDPARLSTVNLAEVIGRFVIDGHDPGTVLQRLTAFPWEVAPAWPWPWPGASPPLLRIEAG